MKKLTRLAIIGGASALALALSAPALAAFTPQLDVSVPNGLGASGKVRIHTAVAPTDDTTARLVIYSPVRFTATAAPSARSSAPPTLVCEQATSAARSCPCRARSRCARRREPPSSAACRFRSPSSRFSAPARRRTRRTGSSSYGGGQRARAGGVLRPHGRRGAGARHVEDHVLPASGRLPGGHARPLAARHQARGRGVDLQRRHLHEPGTAGLYMWASIWTPYNPGVGTANAAGTVTAISVNPLPVTLTLRGSSTRRQQVRRARGQGRACRPVHERRQAAAVRGGEGDGAQAVRLHERHEGNRRVHGHQEDGEDDLLPGATGDSGRLTPELCAAIPAGLRRFRGARPRRLARSRS